MAVTEGPLRGVRVLEFSQIVAAPFAGVILSDLGADVVKAEPPGGDPHRHSGAVVPQNGKRFQSLNRGKRSVVIDLQKPEGQELVHRIVPQFDVVTVNYRPGVAKRLRIDYSTLKAVHPSLVYCEASGFGYRGPLAQHAGMDNVAAAYSGLLVGNEKIDEFGAPGLMTPSIADITTGFSMVVGIVSALYHRSLTGEGQLIQTSLLRSAIAIQDTVVMREPVSDATSRDPMLQEVREALRQGVDYATILRIRKGGRLGVVHRHYYGSFQTKDRPITIGALTAGTRAAARRVLGIADDPSEAPDYDAAAPEAAELAIRLTEKVQAILRERPSAEWVARFTEAGVPVAAANLPEEMVDDPQVQAEGIMVELEHEVTGKQCVAGPIVEMSATPLRPVRAAPGLAAHTDELLSEAGLTMSEIEALRSRGVIE